MNHRRLLPILTPPDVRQRPAVRAWSRREFIELTALAVAAFSARCPAPKPAPTIVDAADLPSLGGAPDSDQGKTVAAFVDTVVPGKHRDPTGAPGALDVDAAAAFFEPGSAIANLTPLLVLVLDTYANEKFRRRFAELRSSERDEALDLATAQFPQVEFAIQLAKVSYFSSEGARAHFGYPGANNGYIGDADFSFRSALTRSHPAMQNGNYP